MIIDDAGKFNWAYKGFQYPLPPSWKRAIRLEDQIQWLLQAIFLLNESGLSSESLDETLAELEKTLRDYSDAGDELVKNQLLLEIGELASRIDGLAAGSFYQRSCVDGQYHNAYVSAKQAWDMLRTYSLTYDQVKATGKTYDEIHADGYSYYDVELFAGTYYGDGQQHAKFTDPDTVAYNNPGLGINVGLHKMTTYNQLNLYGFYSKEDNNA